VFEISGTTLTTLVSFNKTNGANPYSSLIQGSDGNFYGTTELGGTKNAGTVFKITPSGTLTTLVSFHTTNGAYPLDSLIQGSDGNFYGTTEEGGTSHKGTVFKITPSGTLTTLVSFNGSNGSSPYAGLIQGSDGNFYGTTEYGGPDDYGTVFMVTPSGTLTTLVSFNFFANGAFPLGSLIQGRDGSFYGTTDEGGPDDVGTVFKLTVTPAPPVAPTNLTATAKSRGTASLTWTAANGASSYNVYEGPAPGQEAATPIQTGLTNTKATVKSLTDGQTYCFKVAGVDANGVSPPSNEACITAE
jgi:uncharacterized repeat protein (TIGR03803 family)